MNSVCYNSIIKNLTGLSLVPGRETLKSWIFQGKGNVFIIQELLGSYLSLSYKMRELRMESGHTKITPVVRDLGL